MELANLFVSAAVCFGFFCVRCSAEQEPAQNVSVQDERERLLKENKQLQVDAVRAEIERLKKANELLRKSVETQEKTNPGYLPLTEEQTKLRSENEKLRAKLIQAECDRLRKENETLKKSSAPGQSAGSSEFYPANFTPEDFERLKNENRLLREQQQVGARPIGATDNLVRDALNDKYGRNPPVTSGHGRLQIDGLLQVWYYSFQKDLKAWVDSKAAAGTFSHYGQNDINTADSFRIRRAEIRFNLDLTENISAHIMIDPAREAASFPSFPSNQGTGVSGESDNFTNAGFAMQGTALENSLTPVPIDNVRVDAVRNGTGFTNKLLQDAYINYHNFIPHHDFSIGQFKRHLGEEGTRDEKELDFIERSMITQMASVRDAGVQAHGSWMDSRYQYWLGGFNGAGTAFQSRYNRADDNNEKDLVLTVLGRPVWNNEKWGDLEFGGSILYGWEGRSGSTGRNAGTDALEGLNRTRALHKYFYGWAMYKPRGPLAGTWFRGEGGHIHDRFAPGEVASFPDAASTWPGSFDTFGWYAAAGYKLSDSIFADALKCKSTLYSKMLLPMEFAFRFENMGNLFFQSLDQPGRQMRIFHTRVLTSGINYYICGQAAKIQLNYNMVDEENQGVSTSFDRRQLREVKNNNLVLNFQVFW
ncbi:MAG TPA: porin [Planctomycetota bacterium]|jgi:hypothetical protein